MGSQEVSERNLREITGVLREIFRRLYEYKGIEVVEGSLCIDHIHMCLAIPPKYSVSAVVGYLKGKSAMVVFERYSKLRKNFKGHSYWPVGIM